MTNSEILALIALGIAAIFGLQEALKLAIKHPTANQNKELTPCKKIFFTKEAFFVNIPISYLAVIFYIVLLIQLFQITNEDEIQLYWINIEILFAVFSTIYYAFIMFVKLRIICFGCLCIYFANILMGASLLVYHFC